MTSYTPYTHLKVQVEVNRGGLGNWSQIRQHCPLARNRAAHDVTTPAAMVTQHSVHHCSVTPGALQGTVYERKTAREETIEEERESGRTRGIQVREVLDDLEMKLLR